MGHIYSLMELGGHMSHLATDTFSFLSCYNFRTFPLGSQALS